MFFPFFKKKRLLSLIACSILLTTNIAMATPTSDNNITREVNHNIESEKLIGVDYYKIRTKDGIVYLEGRIETDSQAEKIISAAQSVNGVRDVNTKNLKVTSSKSPIEDTYITAKVKGIYLREKLFLNENVSPWKIKVETKNGVVYLSGLARNKSEHQNAVRLAKSVNGVKRVESSIKLIDEQ